LLCLNGTLSRTDRVAARAERGHHRWYSGKHHAFGGSAQLLCDPGDFPLWVSEVRPGSTHDLTAAREALEHERLDLLDNRKRAQKASNCDGCQGLQSFTVAAWRSPSR